MLTGQWYLEVEHASNYPQVWKAVSTSTRVYYMLGYAYDGVLKNQINKDKKQNLKGVSGTGLTLNRKSAVILCTFTL